MRNLSFGARHKNLPRPLQDIRTGGASSLHLGFLPVISGLNPSYNGGNHLLPSLLKKNINEYDYARAHARGLVPLPA